ncbi:MAG: hypothetical protein M3R51_11000 [Candidatus Eremiobacteraeota bacterium]|nr:hypothetical protein [Candidatus Eremiobacteraeota bacterium]
MIGSTLPAVRAPRTPQAKSSSAPAKDDDPETQAQQRALAAQRQAFDLAADEAAELEREREALEQLMLAQLKDEDEIVKKFIAMI